MMELVLAALVSTIGAIIVAMLGRQKRALAELRPNHGTSLKDTVDHMAHVLIRVENKLDQHIIHHNDSA